MIRRLLIPHALWALILVTAGVHAAGTETPDNTLLGQGTGGSLTASGVDNTLIGVNADNGVTSQEERA